MINNDLKFVPVQIAGVGKGVPDKVITNDDLSKILDTNDEWISTRTGIKERRVVSGNETSTSLASKASLDALKMAKVNPEDVDLIIAATSIPDNLYPSLACEVQKEIGATKAAAFGLVAACTGFIYGLNVAANFIRCAQYKNVLIIGADIHSRFVDWEDRSTCVLFGDGAGAMVLKASESSNDEILGITLHSDGSRGFELTLPLSGDNCPLVEPNKKAGHKLYMNGQEIYKFAVNTVPGSVVETLEVAGLGVEDLDFLVPHQANTRIIETIRKRLKLTKEQVYVNLPKYGNTSSASIPIALTEALEEGKIKKGSKVAISGFGAGLTWGTAIIEWNL